MNDEQLFNPILDDDEKIQEIFRPNAFRYVGLPLIFLCTLLLLCIVPFTVMALIEGDWLLMVPFFVPVFLIGILLAVIYCVQYKKTSYCYTNKRVIVRSGFIGVDYHAIDFDLIGGMDVHVDFLDKLVKPNTGTIVFASAASPIVHTNQKISAYSFKAIENPYEIYKRVKAYSSKNKDGNFNS